MRALRGRSASERRKIRTQPGDSARFTATEAKNEFGRALEMALRGEAVVITKHDAPKAILISIEQFNKLAHAAERELNTLSGEFDALLERMQAPAARAAMDAAFAA